MKNPFQSTAFTGYRDDKRNPYDKHGVASMLVPPSKNVRLTLTGEAYTRPGYEVVAYDFSLTGKPARGWYMQQYDLTFFAVGTKVYYIDHNNSDAMVDTGITITDGQAIYTRFEEYAGCVLVTNQVDGAYLFMVTKLNGAVSAGATSIVTDIEGCIKATRFDAALTPATKNIRVQGTNETYTGTNTTAGSFTGITSVSQNYSDNAVAIVVYNLTAVFPKAGKIVAWKESLNFLDLTVDEAIFASDTPTATLAFTPFITSATIENMVAVSGGTSGTEIVGKFGRLVNAVATRDYLYLFKDNAVAYIDVSTVNVTSGARPPRILSEKYGSVNGDCAVDMGGIIPFLTPNKRIIAIKTATVSGANVVFPDESFDQDIRNTLNALDDDQSEAKMFYHGGGRMLYVQVSVDSEIVTLVYDNNIGKWLPPDTNKSFAGYYERKGTLYATALTEDTVYQVNLGNTDDGFDIDCYIALGEAEFNGITTEWKDIEMSGGIALNMVVSFDGSVDGGTPTTKTINATDYSFTGAQSIGDVQIGGSVVGGSSSSDALARWSKRWQIAPTTYGQRFQPVLYSVGTFSLKSYKVNARPLANSTATIQ